MNELKDRIAIVTGAAGGIGKAIAMKLSKHGAKVAVVDINVRAAETLVAEMQGTGLDAIAIGCDVREYEQVMKAVESCVHDLGEPHILVNNAGISPITTVENISLEEWNKVLSINLTGPFLFTRAVLPYLKKAGARGRIINIGSLAGQCGGIAVGLHYTASKGGIMAMTKQLAKVLAPYSVTVNNISPGTADTPLINDFSEETKKSLIDKIPLGRLCAPEDVASAVYFLTSDDACFITGATINVNGGMFIA